MNSRLLLNLVLILLSAAAAFAGEAAPQPVGKATLTIDGKPIPPTNGTVAGVWFFADFDGEKSSQLLLLGHENAGPNSKPNYRLYADLVPGEEVEFDFPASQGVDFRKTGSENAGIAAKAEDGRIRLTLRAETSPAFIKLSEFTSAGTPISLDPERRIIDTNPIPTSPNMTPRLTEQLIEWDWRMQDGIETPREPRTFRQAIAKRLPQCEAMLADQAENAETDEEAVQFEQFEKEYAGIAARYNALNTAPTGSADEESLWRDLHRLHRKATLSNPKFKTGPLVFAKHVPTIASHQLTQSYGVLTRPGGGIFVLDKPGESMDVRSLTAGFPNGGFLYPSVSYDGKTIFFSFCETDRAADRWSFPDTWGQYQHLWRIDADGKNPVQLTSGWYDDFAPRELPDGKIVFSSTRRGGFHRCGMGPCPVFTLATMNPDGTDVHPISYHETHEWTPDVMNDGRVIYTRWDYVDRDAVYYQNLWTTRPDGTDVRIYYGNNTFNPNGIWEPKSIPGSSKIMAIGGPHHGMSAGSIMLLDNSDGVDGPEAVTRLTPEVLYPEDEVPLPAGRQGTDFNRFDEEITSVWNANRPDDRPADRVTEQPEEQLRWPVHVFKSPWPLSETYFIASYSFDKLIGEIGSNIPNQFGIYFCDAFGGRELIYRDPNISSVWAAPLAPRPAQPKYISTLPDPTEPGGTFKPSHFYIQNIYESWPFEIPEKISSLRIVQVLPKTTPHANNPRVGAANASPGKQILGTVPVEEDGSAQFVVPSRTPFLIQALNEEGQMVQGMRSLIYGQPGETVSCTGCHEDRLATVAASPTATIASRQTEPRQLAPGPTGSKPFSYPILIQPLLDRHCVECHGDENPEGGINLTGAPEGTFTKSYNALISRVSFTYWGAPDGNNEPMTTPYLFGSTKSDLIRLLKEGHHEVELTPGDWERLYTWIDGGNALFYGTFKPEDQALQQRGEQIEGPDME